MSCITCPKSDAWHRSQLENLESTIGPRAAQDFEQAHPEGDEGAYDERHPRAIEHEDGWHAEYVDADCPTCREESAQLGMSDKLPELERWSGSHPNHPHGSCDRCTDDDPGVRPTPYVNSTDRVIAESGVDVDPRDRSVIAQAAGRETNMTGGRYSDALRAQLATYARLGRDGFLQLHDESTRVAQQLGYVR